MGMRVIEQTLSNHFKWLQGILFYWMRTWIDSLFSNPSIPCPVSRNQRKVCFGQHRSKAIQIFIRAKTSCIGLTSYTFRICSIIKYSDPSQIIYKLNSVNRSASVIRSIAYLIETVSTVKVFSLCKCLGTCLSVPNRRDRSLQKSRNMGSPL